MKNKTKLYLLSGFLGSGKTTFLKRIVEELKSETVGIIMNEFGKISIDGPILKKDNLEMIELTRGSIFCSCLKLSFAEALIDLSKKNLDYVIVESSGLADPSNIGEILEAVENYADNPYAYCGSITVVDGVNFMDNYREIETISRQIECADLSIINKIDLIGQEELTDIEEAVSVVNSNTRILKSSFFNIPLEFLGHNLCSERNQLTKESLNTPENKPKTISLKFNESVEKEKMERFLMEVSDSTYRIKGFVELDKEITQVDVVGKRIDYLTSEKKFEESTLVFISKIGPQIIRVVDHAWKENIGIPIKLAN